MGRRSSLAVAVLVLVAVVLALGGGVASASSAPDKRGAYGIGEYREDFVDSSRGRAIGLLVLYPQAVGTAELPMSGFPLIVFNHGFLLRGDLYRSYGEHLASHGFVVALPTYAMSFFGLDHRALAADARFVLDHCLALNADASSKLHGLVDESRIGASGHSLGGKLALLEAVTDERIRAIATLDPVDGGGPGANDPVLYPSVAPELMSQIHAPLLFIGAEFGGMAYFLIPCAPPSENYQQFFAAANPPAMEISQLGAGHGQYVDAGAEAAMSACAPGTVETEWVRSSSATYLTAFFLGHLKGEADALAWLDARLADDEAQGRILVRRKV